MRIKENINFFHECDNTYEFIIYIICIFSYKYGLLIAIIIIIIFILK